MFHFFLSFHHFLVEKTQPSKKKTKKPQKKPKTKKALTQKPYLGFSMVFMDSLNQKDNLVALRSLRP